jgi:hypothetical protein
MDGPGNAMNAMIRYIIDIRIPIVFNRVGSVIDAMQAGAIETWVPLTNPKIMVNAIKPPLDRPSGSHRKMRIEDRTELKPSTLIGPYPSPK